MRSPPLSASLRSSRLLDSQQVPLLGPVSVLDCVVFCAVLAPQLLLQAGVISTFACILRALPFLVIRLPLSIILQRLLKVRQSRAEFGRNASSAKPDQAETSLFEDVVLRCVRWAFIHMPPRVGRVFFSRGVALPFLRFRQLRHSLFGPKGSVSSLRWREHVDPDFRGVWIVKDPSRPPDIVLFFAHGGGYVMGSSYFYVEFLLSWASLLIAATGNEKHDRFQNPAVFSLDYTLAPDATYPTQLREAVHAYAHVLSTAARDDPERIVVAGDSAGGGLMLSLLLYLGKAKGGQQGGGKEDVILGSSSASTTSPAMAAFKRHLGGNLVPPIPRLAVLISPWVTLWSNRYKRSLGDYVDVATLGDYATQFLGRETASRVAPNQRTWYSSSLARIDPLMSPGNCFDIDWWRQAMPSRGLVVTYCEEEVFAPEIRVWTAGLQKAGINVEVDVSRGLGVHAWPVAAMFLGDSDARRFGSLRTIVEAMKHRLTS